MLDLTQGVRVQMVQQVVAAEPWFALQSEAGGAGLFACKPIAHVCAPQLQRRTIIRSQYDVGCAFVEAGRCASREDWQGEFGMPACLLSESCVPRSVVEA